MLKFNEVKSLDLFREYHEEVSKRFINENKDYFRNKIFSDLEKTTKILRWYDKDGNYSSAAKCPSCGKIHVNNKRRDEYSFYHGGRFECSNCDYVSSIHSPGTFLNGCFSYDNIVSEHEEPEAFNRYLRETLVAVVDYIPGELLIMGNLYFLPKGDVKKINQIMDMSDVLEDELDSRLEKAFKEIESVDLDVDIAISKKETRLECTFFSISKKYGFRSYCSNFPMNDSKPSLIDYLSFNEGLSKRLHVNLFDMEEKDVNKIVNELKHLEKFEKTVRHIGNQDTAAPSVAIKKLLTTTEYENYSAFKTLEKISFREERNSRRRKKRGSIIALLEEKFNEDYFRKIIDEAQDFSKIENTKHIVKDTNFLVNEILQKRINKIDRLKLEYVCLHCNTHHVDQYSDIYNAKELTCDNCGATSPGYNASLNQRIKSYDPDVNNLYQFDNAHAISYNKNYNILSTLEVEDGIYASFVIRVRFDLNRIKKEDVDAILKDKNKLYDYFVSERAGNVNAAIYEEKTGRISYFNSSLISFKWEKRNFSEIKSEFSSNCDRLNNFDVDYVYDTKASQNVLDKLKINEYNAYDYFVKEFLEDNNKDHYYNYVHFFPKSYFSYIIINPAYELIMKDLNFSHIFLDTYIDTLYKTKSHIESLIDKDAKKPSEAIGLSNHKVNILNNFKEEKGFNNYDVNMMHCMNLYEEVIKEICDKTNTEYTESILNYNGYNFFYKTLEAGCFAEGIYNTIRDHFAYHITSICNMTEVSINSAINYIDGLYLNQGIVARDGMSEWNDYIRMAINLEYDLSRKSILYPNSLKREHDKAVMFYNKLKQEDIDISFKSIVKANKHLEYKSKEHSFILPKSSSEVIREGMNLSHCVGSYVDSIASGHTLVLFMRKNDSLDESFFTIEIRNNTIVQLRGVRNSTLNTGSNGMRDVKDWIKKTGLKMNIR